MDGETGVLCRCQGGCAGAVSGDLQEERAVPEGQLREQQAGRGNSSTNTLRPDPAGESEEQPGGCGWRA